VRERTRELVEAQIEIIDRLAIAAEFRDDNTGQHTHRVGQMSSLLAKQLGLGDDLVALIARAAPLHDVGKIGVPDMILLKMGKLTPEEFEIVKTHTVIGARILSGGKFPLLRLAEEIAFSHHERDGTATPAWWGRTSRWPAGSSRSRMSSTRSRSSGRHNRLAGGGRDHGDLVPGGRQSDPVSTPSARH
jgi:hypothetical protein